MSLSTSEPSTHVEIPTAVRGLLVGGLIYLFLVGVSSLEKGINIMGADTQEQLFSSVSNPIAGLCIGILGTVLVQSSSASTAVIVGLVATGNIWTGMIATSNRANPRTLNRLKLYAASNPTPMAIMMVATDTMVLFRK